ncbi:MAG: ribosomal protein S18-alanine N-acetyltransferase [Acidobacteria bacterium]|nr:ribosomal protein S18-alanine N-acetyltransferase [Acidobacteriota bacterium]
MSSPKANTFSIREYQPADFPTLCTLDRLCFPEGIAYPAEEMALGLEQHGAFALVAEISGQVVGFILAHRRGRQWGHIITIDVHPQFQHQGLGARLMELAEQRLSKSGAIRLLLEVWVENRIAIQFYEKRGYAVRQVLSNYYRDGSDAYLMEKNLA